MLILFFVGGVITGFTQVLKPDSLVVPATDSQFAVKEPAFVRNERLAQKILLHHPYFNFRDRAVPPPYTKKINPPGREPYFYIMAGLLLCFAVLRSAFAKYCTDLFNLFFRRSLRQKQIKQQVVQNALPSLLFNIFFILTAGYYCCLLIEKNFSNLSYPLWQLLLYCMAGLGIVYLGKYLVLKLLGMVFKMQKLTNNYIFLIFLIHKIVSVLLLPLLLIISVTSGPLLTVAWTLSWILLFAFISYRYIAAIGLVRKENNISFSHFLLYAIAFELLPTVMLYKGVLLLIGN